MIDPFDIINKYYPAGSRLRDIYLHHCESVAREALTINSGLEAPLDEELVRGAALLHDIGIYATHAPSIMCEGTNPYIAHGVLGAELLRREGTPEQWVGVAEHHTGAGLTAEEIIREGLPLPHRDMLPENRLERLICYADKFYSKSGDMKRKSLESVVSGLARFGDDSVKRFMALHEEFYKSVLTSKHGHALAANSR